MGWFVFLVLSLLLSKFPSHTSLLLPLCNHDDASSLLSFKSSFSLNSSSYSARSLCESCYPKTKSWENGTNCCLWDGVSCDTKSGHVIGIDLSCSCLQGKFHPNTTLFQLTHLQTLNLAQNDFFDSPMPSGFGDLVALTHLNLSVSGFGGVIPSKISHLSKLVSLDLSVSYLQHGVRFEAATLENLIVNATDLRELTLDFIDMSSIKMSSLSLLVNFSSSLVSLSLRRTKLQGMLPNNILCLPNLQYFDLSSNMNLEGELPKFNWSTPLRYLNLFNTAFPGKVSTSISHLKSLNYLNFGGCGFEGPVLLFLSNLTQLNYLVLAGNNFNGEIPLSFSNLQDLTYIDFSENNFEGSIPQSLGNITQLYHIDLSWNNFRDEIPDLFSKLGKLERLDLSGNNLEGELPSSLFGLPQLRDLSCANNKLVGSIPNKTSGLSHLTSLDLSSNSLNGTIPYWCFSLSSLLQLSLGENQLNGPIGEFSAFSLQTCDFSHNKLQGNIPKSMFHLQNLTSLTLSSNNLSGHVEFHKFSNRQHLFSLDLSHNNFLSLSFNGGADYTFPNLQNLYLSSCNINNFPDFLIGLKDLVYLDLSRNQIHGTIPTWFNNMGNLTFLDLSHNLLTSVGYLSLPWMNLEYINLSFNKLEGDIPVPSSSTQLFFVSNNKLSGHISSAICNASSLSILNLSHNNLSGKLPQCLGTLPYLSVLDLQRNNLSGIIPKTYLEIEALETMNFNGNQLEGPLPQSVVKCKQLRLLDLGQNNIHDTFPTWLESLQELQVLVLRGNRFSGTINCFNSNNTFPKLQVFDISNNSFTGNIPRGCIKNFEGMMVNISNGMKYLNSKKYFSWYNDSIVVTLKGNTVQMERIFTTFTSIDLSNNRFEGVIPAVIGELKSLKGLNFSHNRITGFIPKTFGGLENLEWLDLSSNMLMGEIPMTLTNLYSLSFLNLSQNQLVGMIPTGKQFNTFQNDSYQGNPGLCGLPLSKSCNKNGKQKIDSATFQHDEQFKFGWKPVVIGYGCGGVFGIVLGYIVFFIGRPQWLVKFFEGILNQRFGKKSHRSNANRRRDTIRVFKGSENLSTHAIEGVKFMYYCESHFICGHSCASFIFVSLGIEVSGGVVEQAETIWCNERTLSSRTLY